MLELLRGLSAASKSHVNTSWPGLSHISHTPSPRDGVSEIVASDAFAERDAEEIDDVDERLDDRDDRDSSGNPVLEDFF